MSADTDPVADVTELILEVFRFNGALLDAGDKLVEHLGLTSARWQVLGAIHAGAVALPVAHVARNMGLSRQAVQRLANEMEHDGLVAFRPNPHHARAKLVVMTDKGTQVYAAAMTLQREWAAALVDGQSDRDVTDATELLRALRQTLEG